MGEAEVLDEKNGDRRPAIRVVTDLYFPAEFEEPNAWPSLVGRTFRFNRVSEGRYELSEVKDEAAVLQPEGTAAGN